MALRLTSALFLTLLCAIPRAEAGWIHEVRTASDTLPAVHVLRYEASADVGFTNFADALDAIADARTTTRLDLAVLHERMLEADFQEELLALLRTSAPQAFEDAQRPSGNHDDPALLALRRPFLQAVSDSQMVTGYRAALAKHRLRVADVQLEKLTLDAFEGTPRLRCFLWLTISPV
ncbi:hypothetical protein [Pseudoxanthomonas sp.]|jgi:hypothetical protein|uniref:hypothetical protein n=1 Tax=Pseudoxanthomonas sp. TaxID=1871049 RepID=UPI002E146700|nr:hypothetical protein [Pseudoxanthomonas sp.]